MEYGLRDTVRVDHGTEWALVLHIQNMLSNFRNDPSRRPYCQTSSRQVKETAVLHQFIVEKLQNHTVERLWVEVNNRVNYPIKSSLIRVNRYIYIVLPLSFVFLGMRCVLLMLD